MLQGGVDQELVRWVLFDGVGRAVRNGLNFTERGYGVRAGLGCSDRGNTAVSQLKPGDFNWGSIFGSERGARWFHTGGIFAALSDTTIPRFARNDKLGRRFFRCARGARSLTFRLLDSLTSRLLDFSTLDSRLTRIAHRRASQLELPGSSPQVCARR